MTSLKFQNIKITDWFAKSSFEDSAPEAALVGESAGVNLAYGTRDFLGGYVSQFLQVGVMRTLGDGAGLVGYRLFRSLGLRASYGQMLVDELATAVFMATQLEPQNWKRLATQELAIGLISRLGMVGLSLALRQLPFWARWAIQLPLASVYTYGVQAGWDAATGKSVGDFKDHMQSFMTVMALGGLWGVGQAQLVRHSQRALNLKPQSQNLPYKENTDWQKPASKVAATKDQATSHVDKLAPYSFNIKRLKYFPDVQVDFMTADVKMPADGSSTRILECNGLNSGLTGYEAWIPNSNLKAIFLQKVQAHFDLPIYYSMPSFEYLREFGYASHQSQIETIQKTWGFDAAKAVGGTRVDFDSLSLHFKAQKPAEKKGLLVLPIPHILASRDPDDYVLLNRHGERFAQRKDCLNRHLPKRYKPKGLLVSKDMLLDPKQVSKTAKKLKRTLRQSDTLVIKTSHGNRATGLFCIEKQDIDKTVAGLHRVVTFIKQQDVFEVVLRRKAPPEIKQILNELGIPDNQHEVFISHLRKHVDSKDTPILFEEYVNGTPITSPQTGQTYDPTMRLAFGLIRQGTKVTLIPLDAYWKLPPQPIGSGPLSRISSAAGDGEKSLPADLTDFKTAWTDLTKALKASYHPTFLDSLRP